MAYRCRLVATLDNGDKHTLGIFDSYDEAIESINNYASVMTSHCPFIGGNGVMVSVGHMVSLEIVEEFLSLDLSAEDLKKRTAAEIEGYTMGYLSDPGD